MTDWTFADQNWVPASNESYIGFNMQTQSSVIVLIRLDCDYEAPTNQWIANIQKFGFGKLDFDGDNSKQYYKSIQNSEESFYSNATNMAVFSMSLRGLGLPPQSYRDFVNLLSIATNGEARCDNTQGGYCVLSQSCSSYPGLWNYTFEMEFEYNSNRICAPLTTFAQDSEWQGQGICNIYVEYLNSTSVDTW